MASTIENNRTLTNDSISSTVPRTKNDEKPKIIVRSSSSIYKRLGLNFIPQRRKDVAGECEIVCYDKEKPSSSPINDDVERNKPSSEAVLHAPVYSKIASPSRLRKPQAVIPLCVGLKSLISTKDDEKDSCRNADKKTLSSPSNFVDEAEKFHNSNGNVDHPSSTNSRVAEHERRTSWIDDFSTSFNKNDDGEMRTNDDNITTNKVNLRILRRFSLSPSDICNSFLRQSTTNDEDANDNEPPSPRDSGIQDDIEKPVPTRTTSAHFSPDVVNLRQTNVNNDVYKRLISSPYDGRTSLNESESNVVVMIPTDTVVPSTHHRAIPVVPAQHCDTDTLRKTAQRNRETAAKLLPKLEQKRNSMSSNKDGRTNNGKRRETQTSSSSRSSKCSSSPRDSVFLTDNNSSSGGSSSGSYDVLSFHDILTAEQQQQRKQLNYRSVSNENFTTNHCVVDSCSVPVVIVPTTTKNDDEIRASERQIAQVASELCHFASSSKQNKFETTSKICRGIFIESEIPIYAVPLKQRVQKQQSSSCVSVNRSTICAKVNGNNMKNSPPPLPRKPPPSLDDDENGKEDVDNANSNNNNESSPSETKCVEEMNEITTTTVPTNSFVVRTNNSNNDCSSSTQPVINISKRPIVPVHPYKEKFIASSSSNKCSSNNSLDSTGTTTMTTISSSSSPYLSHHESSSSNVTQTPTKTTTTTSYRPPVPPKPDRSVVKTPPQLPPKPSNYVLKRPETMSLTNGIGGGSTNDISSLSSCTVESNHDNHNNSGSSNQINVCNSPPSRQWYTVDERTNEEDVLWQQTFDLASPVRRSSDFVSIVYDRSSSSSSLSSSSCEKIRRNYRLEDSRNCSLECFSGEDVSPTPDVVENEKKLLLSKLNNKLLVMRKAYREIEQEIRYNDNVGRRLESMIEQSDRLSIIDKQKYRLHVEDTEKLAHLFLKLSAQLARVENELDRMPPTSPPKEKQHLTQRRQRLLAQLTDAKNLKEDLDRRCETVTTMLRETIFSDEQLRDYENFVELKSRLLVDAREIEDNINLLEERRQVLEQSLNDSRN